MTEQEKYNTILLEIGAMLAQKNERIMFQEFELATLRRQLEQAEKVIEEIREEIKNE